MTLAPRGCVVVTYTEGGTWKVKLSEMDFVDDGSRALIWRILNEKDNWPAKFDAAELVGWARDQLDALKEAGIFRIDGRRASVDFTKVINKVVT